MNNPNQKSILRLTGKVYDLRRPHEKGAWPEVRPRAARIRL